MLPPALNVIQKFVSLHLLVNAYLFCRAYHSNMQEFVSGMLDKKRCVPTSCKALDLIMRYIHYKLESSSTQSAALKTLLRFSGHRAAEFAPAAAACQISCHAKSNWEQFDTSLSLCNWKMVNKNSIKCSSFLIKALQIHLKFTASTRPKLVITPASFPPLHTGLFVLGLIEKKERRNGQRIQDEHNPESNLTLFTLFGVLYQAFHQKGAYRPKLATR